MPLAPVGGSMDRASLISSLVRRDKKPETPGPGSIREGSPCASLPRRPPSSSKTAIPIRWRPSASLAVFVSAVADRNQDPGVVFNSETAKNIPNVQREPCCHDRKEPP